MYGRRPLSRLEAVIYAAAVAVLIGVFLDRMLRLLAAAERDVVAVTVANTESALRTRLALAALTDRRLPPDWRDRSPFEIAGLEPRDYAGERPGVRAGDLARGAWAFDSATRELVYRPRYPIGLSIAGNGGLLRFRLLAATGETEVGLAASVAFRWDP